MVSGEISAELENAFGQAAQRARAKAGVLRQAVVFAGSGVFLAALDLAASPGSLWFMWPSAAWGLAVAVQAALAWRPRKKNLSGVEKTP